MAPDGVPALVVVFALTKTLLDALDRPETSDLANLKFRNDLLKLQARSEARIQAESNGGPPS